MNDVYTEYITVEVLKESLDIRTDRFDARLLEAAMVANTEVDKVLLPYTGDVPMDGGSHLFNRGKSCALSYARGKWFKDNFQTEMAKTEFEEYEKRIGTVIESQKAERNTRTKRASLTASYRTRLLFSQLKRY